MLIVTIALWMLWRTWRGEQMWRFEEEQHHHDERQHIDTGHGRVELSINEQDAPPRWRLRVLSGHAWPAGDVSLLTTSSDGQMQEFRFVTQDDYLQSLDAIPEPHEFTARLRLDHAGHAHEYDLEFHAHDHAHSQLESLELSLEVYQYAHERAHANDIRRRFASRNVLSLIHISEPTRPY